MRTYADYQAMVEAALPEQLGSLGDIPGPLMEAMASCSGSGIAPRDASCSGSPASTIA